VLTLAPATITATAAPSGLTATAVSKSQINLARTDNATNEDGFAIERSTDRTNFAALATVGPNVRAYANTGLPAYRLFYYRVRAFRTGVNSPYSNVASARTLRQ